jgi:hypothetical protein
MVEPKKPEPKMVEPKKPEPIKLEPKKTEEILPALTLTSPSPAVSMTVLYSKDSPPPSLDDVPPPLPTSPPPSELPEEEEEEEGEDEGGFSIGDDQVIVEKPYEKGDERKYLPSNQPKWSASKKPAGQVPAWKAKQQQEGSKQSPAKPAPTWRMRQQQREEEEGKKPLPTWKVRQQLRAEEAEKAEEARKSVGQSTPAKLEVTPLQSPQAREASTPKRVGKLKIPAAFGGSGATPDPPTKSSPLSNRSRDLGTPRVAYVELGKSSDSHPTPPSSPAPPGRKKWAPTPPKEVRKESEKESEGDTPPAIKRLKQLQQKPHLSSLASSPIYKLPVATTPTKSPSHSTATPTRSESGSKPADSSPSSHIAETGTGNVARLLSKFQ